MKKETISCENELIETLEKYANKDKTVLDIGCGSGILSVASLLLGAEKAVGVDIDALAVKTAKENGAEIAVLPEMFACISGYTSTECGIYMAVLV